MPAREDAWKLLNECVKSPSLLKHCLSVEAAMRAYAGKFGEDADEWGICGLLHDFDYERFPVPDAAARTGHPFEGEKVLRAKGYPEKTIRVILGHATYSGVPRDTKAAQCLFAVDELCGFVMAVAHMRPERFAGMTAESVEKRLKNKKFAEKVSREDIARGVAELGADRRAHIELVISAMAGIVDELFPAR